MTNSKEELFIAPSPSPTFFSTLTPLFSLAIPNAFIFVLQNLIDIISLSFVGHLSNGSEALAAVGLGTTWFNLTSYYIVLGLTLVIDTLVSQSYGKGEFRMCGIYYYRTALIVTVCCIPFTFLIISCGPMLRLFGVPEKLSENSGEFAIYLIPSLFISIHFEMVKKFLNAQQIVRPTTLIVICTTLAHVLFCYIFVAEDGLGYLGAALAKTLTSLLNLIVIWVYIYYSGCCKDALVPFTKEVFKEWKLVLELALPSALLMCFDFWVYEIMNMMLGLTNQQDLAANVGLSQVSFILYMIPSGFGNAASTFVGNFVGAGDSISAKYYMRLSLIASGITMLGCGGLAVICSNSIGKLFTSDPEVSELFSSGVMVVFLAEIPDALQVVLSRTLIALGKQKVAAISMFVASYFVLLPLGYVFLIHLLWGVKGYWLAVMVCNIVLVLQYTYWSSIKTDWEEVCRSVKDRDDL